MNNELNVFFARSIQRIAYFVNGDELNWGSIKIWDINNNLRGCRHCLFDTTIKYDVDQFFKLDYLTEML